MCRHFTREVSNFCSASSISVRISSKPTLATLAKRVSTSISNVLEFLMQVRPAMKDSLFRVAVGSVRSFQESELDASHP